MYTLVIILICAPLQAMNSTSTPEEVYRAYGPLQAPEYSSYLSSYWHKALDSILDGNSQKLSECMPQLTTIEISRIKTIIELSRTNEYAAPLLAALSSAHDRNQAISRTRPLYEPVLSSGQPFACCRLMTVGQLIKSPRRVSFDAPSTRETPSEVPMQNNVLSVSDQSPRRTQNPQENSGTRRRSGSDGIKSPRITKKNDQLPQ